LRAIGHIEAGRRFQDVAVEFGVNKSTISRLHRRYTETGSVDDRPRPGQPRVTTVRQDRVIRLSHLRNRFLNATVTARNTAGRKRPTISARTVRRRLLDAGLRCRRPYHGARLTAVHRRNRLHWAVAHARLRNRQWSNVLFSDEKKV